MEDLLDFAVENVEEYAHAAAGFGIGLTATYLTKLNAERKGREMFPEGPEKEWYDSVLEEDPMYDEENFSDGRVMEFYYDNFDKVKKNTSQAFHSVISTGLMDAFETFSLDSDFVGFEDYPEMAAGFYAGMKAAEHTPTPSEAYRSIVGGEAE